jgi:hypothetical protein
MKPGKNHTKLHFTLRNPGTQEKKACGDPFFPLRKAGTQEKGTTPSTRSEKKKRRKDLLFLGFLLLFIPFAEICGRFFSRSFAAK